MKVAMVVEYPLFFGGGELHAFEISKQLAKQGISIDFIQHLGVPIKLKFTSDAHAVEEKNSLSSRLLTVPGMRRFFYIRFLWMYSFLAIPFVYRELIKGRYDIIHVHGFGYSSPLLCGVLAKKHTNSKVVCTLHNDTLRHIDREIVKRLVPKVDAFIAVSSAIQKTWHNNYLVAPSYIPNGVDSTRFSPDNHSFSLKEKMGIKDKFVILSIGRLSKQKGINVLLQALTLLKGKNNNIAVMIGGRGEEEAALKNQVKKLGLNDIVTFVGFVPPELLPTYYEACDLFVLPSIFETFALTQLEALSIGKPVVVTRVVGAQEIAGDFVPSLQAKLVKPNDPEELSQAILWFMANQAMVNSHRQDGANLIRKVYSWEIISNKIANLYRSLRK